jgi:molybdopterin molybdotransferase
LICSGGVSGSDADHVMASVLGVGGGRAKLSLVVKPGKSLAIDSGSGPAGDPVAALVGALLFAPDAANVSDNPPHFTRP